MVFHVLHFDSHRSAARKPLQCCLYISATSTPRREASPRSSSSPSVLSRLLNRLTSLQVTSMVQRGDAATETTSVLSMKPLPTAHCQRHRALHHRGDPDQFPTTGQTFVDSLSHRVHIVIGKCACMVPSPSHTKAFGLRPNDQSCHHETWFHLDFVDWRNTRSQHGEHDRRILLKERPAPLHRGAQKRRISGWNYERPVQPLARS